MWQDIPNWTRCVSGHYPGLMSNESVKKILTAFDRHCLIMANSTACTVHRNLQLDKKGLITVRTGKFYFRLRGFVVL